MVNKIFSCFDLNSSKNQRAFSFILADYLTKKGHKILIVDLELFDWHANYEKMIKKNIITKNVTKPFCIYNFEKNLKIMLLNNPIISEKVSNFDLQHLISVLKNEIENWANLFDYVIINGARKFLQLNDAVAEIVDESIILADINNSTPNDFIKNVNKLVNPVLMKKNKNICFYNFDKNIIENLSAIMQLTKVYKENKKIFKISSFPVCQTINDIKKINQWSEISLFIDTFNF